MLCALGDELHESVSRTRGQVLTVVEPAVRLRLDTAIGEVALLVHAATVSEAIAFARENVCHAVLVSPTAVQAAALPDIGKLRSVCSASPMIALVEGGIFHLADKLLVMGSCGVREVVDISTREGLGRLRQILSCSEWGITNRISEAVLPVLDGANEEMRFFIGHLIRTAPSVTSLKELAKELRVRHSTLTSRFYRAQLPSPKQYLVLTRLLYASALLEIHGVSVSQTACRLNYSSPQSFGRHVSEQMGVTGVEFRETYSFRRMLDQYVDRLLVRNRSTFKWFEPLGRSSSSYSDLRHRSTR